MFSNKPAIVCVDDEEIILRSLGEQLKRHLGQDYSIELASGGLEAMTLCEELSAENIDIALVISDQMMPEMSGDKFLIKLHALYPKTLKILLTGRVKTNSIVNIVNAASLYRYIDKPWDETDLLLTVKEALKFYGQKEKLIQQNDLLKQTNLKLSKSLDLILATIKTTNDGILVVDPTGKVITNNSKFIELLSIDCLASQFHINSVFIDVLHQLAEPVYCNLKDDNFANGTFKQELLRLNNRILESSFQNQELDGELVGTVWRIKDVTDREKAKKTAAERAYYDTITQLPKRRILTCQLADAIAKIQHDSQMVAVMFVELDRFKIVSDTLGHKMGDRLLQEVVTRLKKSTRGEDVIARWGRDEFTLLLPEVYDKKSINAIAQRILNSLKLPFEIEKQRIYVSSHIGIAVYPEHGMDAETMLKNADAALSQAQKSKQNNYRYYNSADTSKVHQRLTIENQLYSALDNNEFTVYYQPIVNIITGKISKMEALLRWNNPKLGTVSPGVFIPLAEENGSIIPIGEWVLKTACNQNKTWQKMGLDSIKMSVNLSVRQFQQPNLVSVVNSILHETQLSPSDLEVEITESVTMQDVELAEAILHEFRQIGIGLSMDDFGTGYSSLGYLKKFPFNTIKIDRSFIKDLHFSTEDLAIVDAIITLGRGLNLDVVAEGVETQQLKNLLRNLGCEYIQGYLYSKPVPAAEATQLLERNNLVLK